MRDRLRSSLVAIAMLAAPSEQRADGPAAGGQFAPLAVHEHWDVSGSLVAETRARVAEQLGDVAPLIRALPSLRRWEIHAWATRADLLAPSRGFVGLPRLASTAGCAEAIGEGAILQAVQEEARRHCDARRRAQEGRAAVELGVVQEAVRAARTRISPGRPARQTCFWQLLSRLVADSRPAVHLVLSDGIDEQCGGPPEAVAPPVGAVRIFVVLIPAQSDVSGRTDPLRRTEEIRRRLPGVEVLWAADLDPEWGWLLERHP